MFKFDCLAKLHSICRAIFFWIRIIGCIVHNLYCIPAYYLINLVLLPLYYISIDYYAWLENYLYYWLLYVVSSWSWGCGLVVHEHGDDIYSLRNDPNMRIVIMANHQSTADVPLMMQAFSAKPKYVLLWVMDAVFKWTNFGLVSQIHGDYFLNTKAYRNGALLKHCTNDYANLKNLFVVFPEGGFRYKRQASSNSFAMKQNLPILNNVTYPRFGAYSELIDPTMGVTHVVDLTICYDDPEHPPSIVDILGGRRVCEIHFYYRIHAINEANSGNIRSEQWLREQWQLKDQILAEHYALMKRIKHRTMSNSTRTSLSSSLRSKASYSSMSPNLSKEQLNMLGEEQTTENSCPQDHLATVSTTTPSTNSQVLVINNNQHQSAQQYVRENGNGVNGHPNGGELIKLDDDPVLVNTNGNGILNNGGPKWDHNNHLNNQTSMDSNFTTTTALSPTDDSQPLCPRFDRTKGRPVVMSWTKLFLIHVFYFSICLIIYEVFVLVL